MNFFHQNLDFKIKTFKNKAICIRRKEFIFSFKKKNDMAQGTGWLVSRVTSPI